MAIEGDIITLNDSAKNPVTVSTFEIETDLNYDISNAGGVNYIDWIDASRNDGDHAWKIEKEVLSNNSFIRMEFKANFISSPEFDQTLSFRVRRRFSDDDGNSWSPYDIVFEDPEIGSNMGVTIRGVYNGTFIDDLGNISGLDNDDTGALIEYTLQFKRNRGVGDTTITTPFGIVAGGNYIFLQELYRPPAQ